MSGFLDYVQGLKFLPKAVRLENTTIVLDASVLFAAHKTRMRNEQARVYTGGSYLWLADTITRIVQKLRHHNVTPIVVTHNIESYRYSTSFVKETGALYERVLNLDRPCSEALQFPLRHFVIARVLRKLGVEVLVADGGRQLAMSTIANQLGCPILATYPRPLLYAIHGGVKFIGGREYWKYLTRFFSNEGVPSVLEWNYKNFIQHLGITEEDFALMAATDELCKSGMENEKERSPAFYKKLVHAVKDMSSQNVSTDQKTDELLRLFGSRSADEKLEFRKALKKHLDVAAAAPLEGESRNVNTGATPLVAYLRSNEFKQGTFNRKLLPAEFQTLVRRDFFPESLWSMLVTRKATLTCFEEHPRMVSAKLCSRGIRQYSYAIVVNFDGPPSGVEYFQCNGEYKPFPTEPEGLTNVSLDEVPDLPLGTRRQLLLQALDVEDEDVEEILASSTPLLTAVIGYWTRHCKPGQEHRDAVSHWTQDDSHAREYEARGFKAPETFHLSERKRREVLHPFAQLSSIIEDATDLNHLLLQPCDDIAIEEKFEINWLLHMALALKEDSN